MKEFVEKLIEKLGEVSYNHFDLKLSDAIQIVSQLAEEYGNGWISVSERLPEDDTEVLVQYDNNNDNHSMGLAFYQRNFGWEGEDFQHYEYRLNVIAWQPKPAPYVQN